LVINIEQVALTFPKNIDIGYNSADFLTRCLQPTE